MGGLANSAKHLWNNVKEGSLQIAEKLGYESAGVTPKSNQTKKAIDAARPKILPMPDEESLRRARRRTIASQPGTGRASTVLTSQDDTLG